MANPLKTERCRLSLDLKMSVREQLDSVVENTGAHSITDLIGRAVTLYESILGHRKNGALIIARFSDGREIEILPL